MGLGTLLGGMNMSNELKKHNQALVQYLLGYDTKSNFTHVLRDALNDPEFCRWSVTDTKALAEYLDTQWGIGLVKHCDEVIEEWRRDYE